MIWMRCVRRESSFIQTPATELPSEDVRTQKNSRFEKFWLPYFFSGFFSFADYQHIIILSIYH